MSARLPGAATLAVALCAASCFTGDDGVTPPQKGFYFPTGLAVSPGGTALFVANSDFDLKYSGGTVQALDLNAVRAQVVALRDSLETGGPCPNNLPNPNPVLAPGPCAAFPEAEFIREFATIGAFASGIAFVRDPDSPGKARIFVPVRGDPSVTYFDVSDDTPPGVVHPDGCDTVPCLECKGQGDQKRCSPEHRIGENASLNKRGLVLPVEPVGIAASDDGRALVVAHQTTAQATLLLNDFSGNPAAAPTLEFPLSNLPAGPTEVAAVPMPALARALAGTSFDYGGSFLMTYREENTVDVLRFNPDAASSPSRPFLTRAFAEGISVNSSGADSRGIVVDGSQRRACEATCGADDIPCLADCARDIPLRVFVANRTPASLLVGEVRTDLVQVGDDPPTGAFDIVNIYDSIALTFGASKVALGQVIDDTGTRQLRVFVVAFDSRKVFIYDPERREIEATIHTGRGPHAIAFDSIGEGDGATSLMFVGHFTDSYLGVVDLDMRHRETFGQMFASIGVPTPPPELR